MSSAGRCCKAAASPPPPAPVPTAPAPSGVCHEAGSLRLHDHGEPASQGGPTAPGSAGRGLDSSAPPPTASRAPQSPPHARPSPRGLVSGPSWPPWCGPRVPGHFPAGRQRLPVLRGVTPTREHFVSFSRSRCFAPWASPTQTANSSRSGCRVSPRRALAASPGRAGPRAGASPKPCARGHLPSASEEPTKGTEMPTSC